MKFNIFFLKYFYQLVKLIFVFHVQEESAFWVYEVVCELLWDEY